MTQAKAATKKPKAKKWWWFWVFVFSMVSGWQTWAWWSWAMAPVATENPKTLQFSISYGTTSTEIGDELARAELIHSAIAWNLWTVYLKVKTPGGYQAGSFELSSKDSPQAIAQILWKEE